MGAGVGAVLAVLAALGYLAHTPARMEASMLLGAPQKLPLGRTSQTGLSLAQGQLNGLAATAMGAGRQAQRFNRLKTLLTGRHAATAIQDSPQLVAGLFPARRRADGDGWHAPAPPGGWLKAGLAELSGGRRDWQPTIAEIRDRLAAGLGFAEQREAALLRVSFRHRDGQVARDILATIRQAAGQRLHGLADARTAQAADNLRARLREASDAHHRESLARLLRRYVVARVRLEARTGFAARTVEPPAVSQRPRYPRPILVLIGAAGAGLAIGAGIAISLTRWRHRAAATSGEAVA